MGVMEHVRKHVLVACVHECLRTQVISAMRCAYIFNTALP